MSAFAARREVIPKKVEKEVFMNQTVFLLILLYLAKKCGCIDNAQFWCLLGLLALDSGCFNNLLSALSNNNNGCCSNSYCNN